MYNLLFKYMNFCASEVMPCNLIEYYEEYLAASIFRAEEYPGSRFLGKAGKGNRITGIR
jgi:hypothetical protein